MVTCGALLRTTAAMSSFDVGFRTGGVVAMGVVENARRRVIEALAADHAVDGIAAASSIPLNGLVPGIALVTQEGSAINAAHNYVSPDYFDLLSIPILSGRNFTPEETVALERKAAELEAARKQRQLAQEATPVVPPSDSVIIPIIIS